MNDIIYKLNETKHCYFCNENSNLDRGFFNLKNRFKSYTQSENSKGMADEIVIVCKCMRIAHKCCLLKKILTNRSITCNKCKYSYLIEIQPKNWSLAKTFFNKEVILFIISTLAMILFLILSIVTKFQAVYYFYNNLLIVIFSILLALFMISLIYIIKSYYSYSFIYELKFLFEEDSFKNLDTKELNRLIEEKYSLIPKDSYIYENDEDEGRKINNEINPKLQFIYKYFMNLLSMDEKEILKNSLDNDSFQKISLQRKHKFANIIAANKNDSYNSITKSMKLDKNFKNLLFLSSLNPEVKPVPKNLMLVNVDTKNNRIIEENKNQEDNKGLKLNLNLNLNSNTDKGRLSDVKDLLIENNEKIVNKTKDKSIKFLPVITNSKKQVTSFYTNDFKNKSSYKEFNPLTLTKQHDNSDTNHISKSLISPNNKKDVKNIPTSINYDKKDNNILDTSSIIQENSKKKFSFTDSEVESIMLSDRNENMHKINQNTVNTLENISNLDYLNSEENLIERNT